MRLQRYINEKWYETLDNHDTDFFINPNSKNMKNTYTSSASNEDRTTSTRRIIHYIKRK